MAGAGLGRFVASWVAIFSLSTSARADGIEGPALVAWFPKYNDRLPNLTTHGSGCLSVPEHMPAGREAPCGKPALTALGTGRYLVSGENLAPFPLLADDSGHAVFIATVGGNAHCFEESTTVAGTTLQSLVRCVTPDTGSDVDSDFSWSYRADSLEHPQHGVYSPNFAYARVTKDGSAELGESLNPLNLRADDVLVTKNPGAGDYTVVFKDLNPLDGSLEVLLRPYNVIVQKTCIDDTAGGAAPDGCYRSVCEPYDWTPGHFDTWDTSVNVRCYASDGTPRDTGFRIFFGDEGITSQGGWDGGYRYGWVNWNQPASTSGCQAPPELVANSQHETPASYFPGLPIEVCRPALGIYEVNLFEDYVAPYSVDGIAPVVSSRRAEGSYCNVASIECGASHGICALPDAPPTTRITLACYDRAGNPSDAAWTLNATY